jgi:hypothetical protein
MCPVFVKNETEDEDVLFATFGKLKPNQDKNKSLVIKEGENLTGVVTDISDSGTYKKIYRLKVKGQAKPVVVLGKSNLNDKMGYGTKKVTRQVKVNDTIQITFDGVKKTQKGRDLYTFSVGIAK